MQRIAVVLSCVTFWLMLRFPHARGVKPGGLTFVTILSMFEKLSAVMNIISVERDWVSFKKKPPNISLDRKEKSTQMPLKGIRNNIKRA